MNTIGKDFIEKTKYKYSEPSDQEKGLPSPPMEVEYDKSKTPLSLPDPKQIEFPPMNVRECMENRRSFRDYSGKALTLEELSYLLWLTQGIKEIRDLRDTRITLRAVPSAGARHAFETYILAQNVEHLKPGIYRFLASSHKLIEFNTEAGICGKVKTACSDQDMLKNCSVIFLWAATVQRMKWRYGERGYRYLFMDSGHVCQNLYLAAESIGLGACALGAFEDDELNPLLGLDGVERFVVYDCAVGKK